MQRQYLTVLCLLVLVRLVFLPLAPLTDPTEARYGVVAQQMALSGDWVTPRVWMDGERVPFLGKPPLFFWLAAGGMKCFGVSAFAARLPSLLAAVGLGLLMLVALRRCTDRQTADLACLLVAVTPFVFGLAGACAVDMLLTAFVVGALYAYLAFSVETVPQPRRRWSLLVFACLAGGFMTKGPVALVLFGLPVFIWTVWRRKWRVVAAHDWLLGIPLFLVLALPWFWLCEQRNPGFLKYFFVNENLLRYLVSDYGDRYGSGHHYPHGAAILMMVAVALPWTPWLIAEGRRRLAKRRREPLGDVNSFLLVAFVSNVLFWCLARQILVTYMLPAVPLAIGWLAVSLPGDSVLRRRLPAICWGTLAVFVIVGMGSMAAMHGRSIKAVFAAVESCARESATPVPDVHFARLVPYSAYFYGGGRVAPHPDELVADTVQRVLQADAPSYLVVPDEYLERIPSEARGQLIPVSVFGQWHLFVPRVGDGAAESP